MPNIKQPDTLFDIALPATARSIHHQCTSILQRHGDPTRPASKRHLVRLNNQLLSEIPHNILEQLRTYQNNDTFIYFKLDQLTIKEETLRNTPMYRHYLHNVLPRLNEVTYLDLSKIECSYEIIRAVSNFCEFLTSIRVDTRLGYNRHEQYMRSGGDWERKLITLANCKSLEMITDTYKIEDGFRLVGTSCIAELLSTLPELKVINCQAVCGALGLEEVCRYPGVYQLKQIDVDLSHFKQEREIIWLNVHCPFVTTITWQIDDKHNYDPVLEALADSELTIDTLALNRSFFTFSESLKTFLHNKGQYLRILHVCYYHPSPATALTYTELVLLSRYCPTLNGLILKGQWYKGDTPNLDGNTRILFPNVVNIHFELYSKTRAIVPILLTHMKRLRGLRCAVLGNMESFLNILETARNEFAYLKVMGLRKTCDTPIPGFLDRVIMIAKNWPIITQICVQVEHDVPIEVVDFVHQINSQIREQNLDLTVSVEGKMYTT